MLDATLEGRIESNPDGSAVWHRDAAVEAGRGEDVVARDSEAVAIRAILVEEDALVSTGLIVEADTWAGLGAGVLTSGQGCGKRILREGEEDS